MQAGRFNYEQGLKGQSEKEVVLLTLKDGAELVRQKGKSYFIKTGNTYRGIDEKFDPKKVLEAIAKDKAGD